MTREELTKLLNDLYIYPLPAEVSESGMYAKFLEPFMTHGTWESPPEPHYEWVYYSLTHIADMFIMSNNAYDNIIGKEILDFYYISYAKILEKKRAYIDKRIDDKDYEDNNELLGLLAELKDLDNRIWECDVIVNK